MRAPRIDAQRLIVGGALITLIVGIALSTRSPPRLHFDPPPPRYIAHAGGAFEGRAYTNSLEALDHNLARGFRVFEIDLVWTPSDELVLLHDWNHTYDALFEAARPQTAEAFTRLPSKHGLTHLALPGLVAWLERNPDAYVITDIKREPIRGLERIKARHPQHQARFIPQIYGYAEHEAVAALGYDKIILTLYKMRPLPTEVRDFAASRGLFGVCMWAEWAEGTRMDELIRDEGIAVFVHTVNDPARWARLRDAGVVGVYTDSLDPRAWR